MEYGLPACGSVQEAIGIISAGEGITVNSDEEIGSFESGPYIEQFAREASRTFVLEPALGLDGKLKTAIVAHCCRVTPKEAAEKLVQAKGHLRAAIGNAPCPPLV